MNTHGFTFCGAALSALPSGALHWPDERLLVVSDLHFGKAARLSAVGGAALPLVLEGHLEGDLDGGGPAVRIENAGKPIGDDPGQARGQLDGGGASHLELGGVGHAGELVADRGVDLDPRPVERLLGELRELQGGGGGEEGSATEG